MAQQGYQFYGTQTKASELIHFINHVIQVNLNKEALGKPKTPICIWGRHGIGKTEIVKQIALDHNYPLAYIAPAQFEEMGDLVGMPAIEGNQTVFRAPEWVPTIEGPGILLIDDVNRADDRILRGIMQLLQNFELISWKLPAKWQIILTANPDGGDYSVTTLDDAMLTRMMHVSLRFDVRNWALWAAQNEVDERGINFVLTYPEIVNGNRTTPRTLVQFFDAIAQIENLSEELGLVKILGDACLDEATISAFIAFVNQKLEKLISPEEILNANDFKEVVYDKIKGMVKGKSFRVDILTTIITRLVNYLVASETALAPSQLNHLKSFLLMDFLPNDLRLIMGQDLINSRNPTLMGILSDPEIGALLLGSR